MRLILTDPPHLLHLLPPSRCRRACRWHSPPRRAHRRTRSTHAPLSSSAWAGSHAAASCKRCLQSGAVVELYSTAAASWPGLLAWALASWNGRAGLLPRRSQRSRGRERQEVAMPVLRLRRSEPGSCGFTGLPLPASLNLSSLLHRYHRTSHSREGASLSALLARCLASCMDQP